MPVRNKDYTISKDAFDFFFKCIGYFNHYAYFTRELWRKVEGFKNTDEAEVKCAFLSLWTYQTMNITTCPIGACWSWHQCPKDSFDTYIEEWNPLFEDFSIWCENQR